MIHASGPKHSIVPAAAVGAGTIPIVGGCGVGAAAAVDPAPSPLWNGDFSTGDFTQYEAIDGTVGDFTVANAPSVYPQYQSFAKTARFQNNGNVNGGHLRILVNLNPHTLKADCPAPLWQGDERWFRDAIYIPSSFQFLDGPFNYVWEIHSFPDSSGPAPYIAITIPSNDSYVGTPHPYDGDGSNNLTPHWTMRIAGGSGVSSSWDGKNSNTMFPPVNGGDYPGQGGHASGTTPDTIWQWVPSGVNVVRDQWTELIVHVKMDWRTVANGGSPLCEWWINRQKVLTYTKPTAAFYNDTLPGLGGSQPGGGQGYFDCGYYSDAHGTGLPQQIYHAGVMIGNTPESIGVNPLNLGG